MALTLLLGVNWSKDESSIAGVLEAFDFAAERGETSGESIACALKQSHREILIPDLFVQQLRRDPGRVIEDKSARPHYLRTLILILASFGSWHSGVDQANVQ